MLKLKTDIFSNCKPNHKYGSAGDEVKVIADYTGVLIVERLIDKNRFAVKPQHLTEEVIIHESAPDSAVTNNKPIINRAPISKKKAASTNQNTLF
jgi:hypothetical protein